ncbi:putative tocopherol C-methyltransferase [Helianthus anomalus]
MWENIWGENMHHGYYNSDDVVELFDHRSAQIRMIAQALTFASVSDLYR